MTGPSNKPKQFKHLTLVWSRDEGSPDTCDLAENFFSESVRPGWHERKISEQLENLDNVVLNSVAIDPDSEADCIDYIDPYEPDQLEELRLYMNSLDDLEELSKAFLKRSWWWLEELHEELRRACSGGGEFSRQLAREAGYDFIAGYAESEAFRGDGPLSTPLVFTSQTPTEVIWEEKIIELRRPHRRDALELAHCLSFMMH